jgi:hypothetical protein
LPTKSLQLDGPDLEELLARAMAEAGPCGRVAAADRVRRGGIAGFFAREHFEVTIEFEDDVSEPRSAADDGAHRVEAPRSWSELADGTEDLLELSGTPRHAAAESGESVAGAEVDADAVAPDGPPATPRGTEARVPSTQKASFAALLATIARDTLSTEDGAEDGAGDTAEVGSERAPGGDAENDAGADVGVDAPETAPQAPSRGPRTWIEAVSHAPAAPSQPVVAADLIPEPQSIGPAPADIDEGSVGARIGPALATVGLPRDLLPDAAVLECLETLRSVDDAHAYVQLALTSALQRLPEAPELPGRAGGLLVAVGDLERALEFAFEVAEETGTDPATVVVASEARHRRGVAAHQLISSTDHAAELAARGRRAPHLTIVAMHAPVSAVPDRWASRILDALRPTAVWGVVGATHKGEDLEAWAAGLDGLDALVVEETASTLSPATALTTGIPVARLDGQRATPALWAALIAGRLLLAEAATHAAGREAR